MKEGRTEMITIYKKNAIPKNMKYINYNDIYFNKYTASLLDERAAGIIKTIDHSDMLSKYMISSRFNGTALNIDKLSTGCKTALNIMYNPDIVFDICECGDNALDVIYSLSDGSVFCSYPFISFEMKKVNICDKQGIREIDSYENLKEWWENEN